VSWESAIGVLLPCFSHQQHTRHSPFQNYCTFSNWCNFFVQRASKDTIKPSCKSILCYVQFVSSESATGVLLPCFSHRPHIRHFPFQNHCTFSNWCTLFVPRTSDDIRKPSCNSILCFVQFVSWESAIGVLLSCFSHGQHKRHSSFQNHCTFSNWCTLFFKRAKQDMRKPS